MDMFYSQKINCAHLKHAAHKRNVPALEKKY